MRKEVKDKWVKALRSGEYKQGGGNLRAGDQFCCLGVLCDLYRKTRHKGKWLTEKSGDTVFVAAKQSRSGMLPFEVMKWAGMKTINGNNIKGPSLVGLNDAGYPFKEIATVIQKNWKDL